jgi:hypothetical protein
MSQGTFLEARMLRNTMAYNALAKNGFDRPAAYYDLKAARRRYILGAPGGNAAQVEILADIPKGDRAAYYEFRPAEINVELPPISIGDLATLSGIAPNTAIIGAAALTMTVTGTNFTPNHTILFNGGAENTVFVNSTTLTTIVDPTTAGTPGAYPVEVVGPGGLKTASAPFTFTAT